MTGRHERGKCSVCGCWFALNARGMIWRHRIYTYDGMQACEGSGLPPMATRGRAHL